jgi:hypothetical protein
MSELAVVDRNELSAQREPSVMQILSQAVLSGNISVDVVERLSRLASENRDYDAKVEFSMAMQRAQEKMKRIGADAVNPQTRSKYATYAKLDGALRPIYSAEGFALSFDTEDCPIADHVRVTCDVMRGGHMAHRQIDMPCDGKGAKGNDVMTKTHATGAAVSYGQRYLLKMIFNVAVGETDDDGNGASRGVMSEPSLVSWLDSIANATTREELKKFYEAAYKEAQAAKDRMAMDSIMAAKDKRKTEISL